MTQNNHLNQMFFQANEPDFNYDIQDVNDQEISDTLPRLRPENWQNLNDYDESQFISVCSHESNLEKNQVQSEYLEKLGKGYDQYCQTKKHNEKPLKNLQQYTVITENQIDQKKSKKKKRKRKFIKKQLKQIKIIAGDKNLPRKAANNIKIEEGTENNQNITPNYSEIEEEERIGMPENKNNLKNISKRVCKYMQSSEFISNSQLFLKLKGQYYNSEDKNKIDSDRFLKNLKRRMYDVVNVLRSSHIIFPQTQNKRKFILPRNTQFQLDKVESEYDARLKKLEQKKSILKMLQSKIKNLNQLRERNTKLQQQGKIQQSQKIHFPLFFYSPKSNERYEVSSREVRITKNNVRRNKKQNKRQSHYNLCSQLDALIYLQQKADTQKQTELQSPMKMAEKMHKQEMHGVRLTQLSSRKKIKRDQQSKYD